MLMLKANIKRLISLKMRSSEEDETFEFQNIMENTGFEVLKRELQQLYEKAFPLGQKY